MQARIPIKSQLNVKHWEKVLAGYWDRQLLELIKFGFPLDFNRACELGQYCGNHSSANDFPNDIEAYLNEELSYGALLGPFDRRRVIVDLSWPQGVSVNAGIDKSTYLTSNFDLTFPTVDDITSELKRLGRGALLYKVDVSRAFRHVKVDPGDYDLLAYIGRAITWTLASRSGRGTEARSFNASATPSGLSCVRKVTTSSTISTTTSALAFRALLQPHTSLYLTSCRTWV